MTSDIVEQLRAWAEPISSGYEVPRAAVTLYEAADEIESLRSRLADLEAERALIIQRAENAEAALVEAEQEYQDARVVREQLEARLAEALLREARTLCSIVALDFDSDEQAVISRIDAHLAREPK
jgi:chromosome segregation ATPase